MIWNQIANVMFTLRLIDSKINRVEFKVIFKYKMLHRKGLSICNYLYMHNEYRSEFVMKMRQI